MRLYPPAYVSARQAADAHELCGVPVRTGSLALLPFCIGAQLAMSEAILVLAGLVRDNDIRLESGAPVLPIGSFATRPSHVPVFRLTTQA